MANYQPDRTKGSRAFNQGGPGASAGFAFFGVRRFAPLSRFGILYQRGRKKKRRKPPHSKTRPTAANLWQPRRQPPEKAPAAATTSLTSRAAATPRATA